MHYMHHLNVLDNVLGVSRKNFQSNGQASCEFKQEVMDSRESFRPEAKKVLIISGFSQAQ